MNAYDQRWDFFILRLIHLSLLHARPIKLIQLSLFFYRRYLDSLYSSSQLKKLLPFLWLVVITAHPTAFPQCWCRQLAAFSVAPCWQIDPEVDAHWSFVRREERETLTDTPVFSWCCFHFPLFSNASLCTLKLSAICGSDGGVKEWSGGLALKSGGGKKGWVRRRCGPTDY